MTSINKLSQDWAQVRNLPVFFAAETTSTNDWAKKEFFATGEDHGLYLADHQSQGRGRFERTWTNTKPGEVLLSTFSFRSRHAVQPIFTPLVGLALFKALAHNWPQLAWSLKAPNDIYLEQGKVAGILVESTSRGANLHEIFVGIGLNVYNAPEVEVAASFLGQKSEIEPTSWFSFLDHLQPAIKNAILLAEKSDLPSAYLTELLQAMRAYPGNGVDKVFPDGSLQVGSEIFAWRDL